MGGKKRELVRKVLIVIKYVGGLKGVPNETTCGSKKI